MRIESVRKPRRRVLTVLLLFIASMIAGSTGSAATAATIYQYSLRGETVYTEFSNFDGCTSNYAQVFATNGQTRVSNGKTFTSFLNVNFSQSDYCNMTVLYASAASSLQPGELVVDNKLGSATLNATVTVTGYLYDYSSGVESPVLLMTLDFT